MLPAAYITAEAPSSRSKKHKKLRDLGRTYEMIANRDCLVAVGEAEQPGKATLIGMNNLGKEIWRYSADAEEPHILATKTGFYLVSNDPRGFVVSKQTSISRRVIE